MLDAIFLQILNMSLTSAFVILFVLLARLLLKKAPKVFSYALWAVVLFRLVCPFSFESVISLLPEKSEPIAPEVLYSQELPEFTPPEFQSGFDIPDEEFIYEEEPFIPVVPDVPEISEAPEVPAEPEISTMQVLTFAGIALWLAGIAALLVYSGVSLIKLKKRLKTAVNNDGNVYISDCLTTPFVIGVFRPRIYLPANLSEEETRYILLHEQTHIRRLDHIVKIVSYLVLCVHWFNPLVWIAFFLSGKDMEMSCDEAVIKKLGGGVKKDYSTSLLALATGKRIVGGSPLAFGEGNTKSRIKNVLSYKKPAFWVIIIALVGVVILAVGLITNPVSNRNAEVDLSDIKAMNIGAEMPEILYCDDKTVIIKGTCGVVMYDFNKHTVSDRITFDTLGELGIDYPCISSSPDGKTLYIAEDEIASGGDGEILCTYKYNVRRKNFKEIKPIKPRDIESFKTGALNERAEDYINMYYLSSWTMADLGDSFVYLRAKPNWAMSTLQLVVCDTLNGTNKVYNVWDGSEPESFTTEELQNHFPEKLFLIDKDDSSSCEFGICDYGALDENQMMAELDNMQGFTFTESEAEFKYVQFLFYDARKPKENISMRYRADVDNIRNQEETVFPVSNDFRVPLKPGNYSYIADITWEDDTKETVYFRITIVSDGKDISQEEAKQKLLDVLNGSDSFDSENLTIKPQNMSVITVLGRNCYAFEEQWKDGVKPDDRSLNSYAVSLNGKKLYIRDAAYGWWAPLSRISDALTPIEFMYNLRENMTIEERADGLYAVMTVPAALPDGYYASNIYADFIAYSNNNYSEKTDLFGNNLELSEPSYRLEAGKTYKQKIDIELDENTIIERSVKLYRENAMIEDYSTEDFNYYTDKDGTREEQAVLIAMYKSIKLENGYVSITVPEKLPEGYAPEDLRGGLEINYPYDGIGANRQEIFTDIVYEAGKTYTEKLNDKIYDGTSMRVGLSFSSEKLKMVSHIITNWMTLEPQAMIQGDESVTMSDAQQKLAAVLKKNMNTTEKLEVASNDSVAIDGRRAFVFKQYNDGGYDTYAITDDFKKVYILDRESQPRKWQTVKLDMNAEPANISVEAFAKELRNGMIIEENNGEYYAKIIMPEVMPKGFSGRNIGVYFRAYNPADGNKMINLFEHNGDIGIHGHEVRAGETYTQKIDMELDDVPIEREIWINYSRRIASDFEFRDRYIYDGTDGNEAYRFVQEIYDSITIKDGVGTITIPKKVPDGYSIENLHAFVRLLYPYDGLNFVEQPLFAKTKFQPGKTYTEKLDRTLYNGTGAILSVSLKNDSAYSEIHRDYYPEPDVMLKEPNGVTSEQAKDKLSAILKKNLPVNEPAWELRGGGDCIVDGNRAFSFDIYRVGGALLDTYAITDDFKKLYRAEYDVIPVRWQELKFDMSATVGNISPEAFLEQLRDSMVIEETNGALYAKMTVPEVIPEGYEVTEAGMFAYDVSDRFNITKLFGKHPQLSDDKYRLEAGKTYTQKIDIKLNGDTVISRWVELKNIKAPHIAYELRDKRIYNTSNDEEQRFLEELYNSISVKNGEAKITFPKKLPTGFATNNLDISVHVSYPGTDSYGETQYLFKNAKFASGKTITEKLTDKIYNGSLLSVGLTLRADRFNETDANIAKIRVYRPLTPEATFNKEAKLIEEASGKLSDILKTVSDGNDRELKNGKKTTINGAPAYSFDMVYKKNVPVMGGKLIGYYAISDDYVKVYEMDRTTEKWALKYDLMKPTAELESLVEQIYDSMTLENGTARIVVPKNFPKGFSGKNLSVDFSVNYGYDSNEGWVIDNLFWNQEFEPGKTYTQKLKHEIADGTEVYRNVSIIAEGKTVSRKYDTIKYPLRRDDYTPKADIFKNGVEFTDKYGDTFKVTLELPKGWELRTGYSHQAVTVYKDGKAIGELFYSDFKLYPGTTEENYHRSVYSGLMLGSGITWDNEYKVISKTDSVYIETCRPMQRETEGGLNPVTTYSKGILSHDRNLLKYMAMSFDENALTDEEWLALAKSVKLSGTKNNQ